MPVLLRPGTADDLPRVFDIRIRALQKDIWSRIIYPNGRSDKTIQRGMDAWREDLTDSATALIVAEDKESKAIVAFCKWIFAEKAEDESDLQRTYHFSSAGKEANDEAWRWFDKAVHGLLSQARKEPYMYLSFLCTDPAHQGKGAGSALLQWGADRADEKRQPCFLASTAAGHDLYLKRGFADMEKFELDASQFGVQEIARFDWMQRPPRQPRN